MATPEQDHLGRFPTTLWSLVAEAGEEESTGRREALGRLLVCYLPALRAHLIFRRQLAPEQAEDLLQEFIAAKVLENDLMARADRRLGRFRTFLLTAVDRFVFNRLRDQRAKKRAPGGKLVTLEDWSQLPEPQGRPSEVFDVACNITPPLRGVAAGVCRSWAIFRSGRGAGRIRRVKMGGIGRNLNGTCQGVASDDRSF